MAIKPPRTLQLLRPGLVDGGFQPSPTRSMLPLKGAVPGGATPVCGRQVLEAEKDRSFHAGAPDYGYSYPKVRNYEVN